MTFPGLSSLSSSAKMSGEKRRQDSRIAVIPQNYFHCNKNKTKTFNAFSFIKQVEKKMKSYKKLYKEVFLQGEHFKPWKNCGRI